MKFKIDIDMSPEELRKVLGLPDVEGFHEDMINRIREQMDAGVDGYDPLTLFKPYLSSGVGSMEALQKMMLSMMTSPYSGGKNSE
ncbi:DUF6489 family protein [Pontibacterium granulatum]|uniref:DUF6489 family protein n=1 Tax=Pontibacterium granulatum TaxID=2036029 RepID=UPI00249B4689|nr:DUF6489 family protein [Pontibacterium granulatum]MDI3324991.1 DUF6489 family protein [Pontibacterium granulatum]